MEKIQQALIAAFMAAFPTFDKAWENVAFKPTPTKPWLAFHFMPVDERIATLGPEGYDVANGLVQIDVNYPIGAGESDSRKTINLLRACFKPQILVFDLQEVIILSRSRAGGRQTDGFYRIPFTVRWRAHLTRN